MAKKTKVHKLTVLIVDLDDLGATRVRDVLENTKYPNYCIAPDVLETRTVEVDWSDDHPLNHGDTKDAAVLELFPEE